MSNNNGNDNNSENGPNSHKGWLAKYFQKDLEENEGKIAIKAISSMVILGLAKIGSNLIKYIWKESQRIKAKAGSYELSASKRGSPPKQRQTDATEETDQNS